MRLRHSGVRLAALSAMVVVSLAALHALPQERSLAQRFLDRLPDGVTIYGLQTMEGRVPTFLLNVDGVAAADVATTMADRGYGVWAHDSWYSLGLREKLPYPQDAVRVGFIHYNTADEIDGFVAELSALL